MTKKTLTLAMIIVFAHIAFVAPFVSSKNILPAGFGALSMTSMALVLVLAARWRIVDRILGGARTNPMDRTVGLGSSPSVGGWRIGHWPHPSGWVFCQRWQGAAAMQG
ncbi:hypothetical protein N9W76_01205 [Planktomarina temperata]|nr:hypothetical protein [Planktomarina temperata]